MKKPHLYKSNGLWAISPSGKRNAVGSILAAKTFQGAAMLARQCYNPRKWRLWDK